MGSVVRLFLLLTPSLEPVIPLRSHCSSQTCHTLREEVLLVRQRQQSVSRQQTAVQHIHLAKNAPVD